MLPQVPLQPCCCPVVMNADLPSCVPQTTGIQLAVVPRFRFDVAGALRPQRLEPSVHCGTGDLVALGTQHRSNLTFAQVFIHELTKDSRGQPHSRGKGDTMELGHASRASAQSVTTGPDGTYAE